MKTMQLCLDCQNGYAHKCRKFHGESISGWTVEMVKVLMHHSGEKKCYTNCLWVKSCPNFIPDATVPTTNREKRNELLSGKIRKVLDNLVKVEAAQERFNEEYPIYTGWHAFKQIQKELEQ